MVRAIAFHPSPDAMIAHARIKINGTRTKTLKRSPNNTPAKAPMMRKSIILTRAMSTAGIGPRILPDDHQRACVSSLFSLVVGRQRSVVAGDKKKHHTDTNRLDDERTEATQQKHHHLNVSPNHLPDYPLTSLKSKLIMAPRSGAVVRVGW